MENIQVSFTIEEIEMPKEETIELRHIRGTIGEKTDLPEGNPRSTLMSMIKTVLSRLSNTPYNMHLRGRGLYNKTINTTYDTISFIGSDGKYVYAVRNSFTGRILRIDLENFVLVDSLVVSSSAPTNFVLATSTDGETYLYCVGENDGIVSKVKLSSFTETSNITLTKGGGYYIASDETYLYVGHTRYITRISIETFTEVDTLDVGAGKLISTLLCFETYLYAGVYSDAPSTLIKIDTDTFTVTSTLTFATGQNQIRSLITDGTDIYAGFITTPGQIVKIDEPSFNVVGTITLAAGLNGVRFLTCDPTHLYAAIGVNPGKIAKISLDAFVFENTLSTTGNEVWGIYHDETFLYAGHYNSDEIVRKYIIPSSSSDSKKINVILEQTHDGTHYIYPANAAGVTVTSGAGAYTKGNYVEIIPVNTITTNYFITALYLNVQTANTDYVVDLATGLAGSEIVIGTVSAIYSNVNRSIDLVFSPPIKIYANTRISARCSDDTGAQTIRVKVRYKQ